MGLYLPIVAYFDTNVFHEIVDRDCQGAGLQSRLESCRRRGEIVLPASIEVTNEIIDGIGSGDGKKARRCIQQLRVQWQLADLKRVINPTDYLVSNEIRAFARGDTSPSPFLENADLQVLLPRMDGVLRGIDKKSLHQLKAEFSNIVGENRHQKSSFAIRMNRHREEAVKTLRGHNEEIPTLRTSFAARALLAAEDLARRAGVLNECKAAGIERLLERPLIRTGIGAYFALWYTRVVSTKGSPPQFYGSDLRDMRHAISAAAIGATFFVCQDCRLRGVLERLNECGLADFKVVDLDSFLRQLPDP